MFGDGDLGLYIGTSFLIIYNTLIRPIFVPNDFHIDLGPSLVIKCELDGNFHDLVAIHLYVVIWSGDFYLERVGLLFDAGDFSF